jgi:glycerol-3-phosphate dehydrogenase (NAD(P)+)
MKSVCVVGQGSWGTAVANIFAEAGQTTVIWGRDPEVSKSINERNENSHYLKGIRLSKKLTASQDLKSCLSQCDLVVNALPTQAIREVFTPCASLLKNKHVVNTAKGIEIGTNQRVSEIFQEIQGTITYSILSGPSFALETAQKQPTAVTLASLHREEAEKIHKMMLVPYFRTYTSEDVVGVELAGALKNIIAIASGVVSGLGLGYNTQAALINRGLIEIMRLGKVLNANSMTFFGLAGMGDLILTCTGPLSRNRNFGVALGQGKTVSEALKAVGGVAEGYYTAKSAFALSQKLKIEMPILEQIHQILYAGKNPKQVVADLMNRDLKDEW